MRVEPNWIDHNDHLNMAYYHVLLDRASDEFWAWLGLGPRYIETTRCSTFAAECHIRYLREVHLKDQVRTAIFLIGADDKRLHTFRQLFRSDGSLAATSENMSLHVDLNTRKVVAFPSEVKDRLQAVVQLHQRLTPPSGIGRRISMKAS
jgi:acyl-CoA thioester hydrolase